MNSSSPQTPLVNPFLSSLTFSSDSSATSSSIPSLFLFSSTLSAAVEVHTLQMQWRGWWTPGTQCTGAASGRDTPELALGNWNTCGSEQDPGTYLSAGQHLGSIYTAQASLGLGPLQLPADQLYWVNLKYPQSHLQAQMARWGRDSSFWEQQPELSSSYGWAEWRFVPLHRGRLTVKPFKWEQGWLVNSNYQALKFSVESRAG